MTRLHQVRSRRLPASAVLIMALSASLLSPARHAGADTSTEPPVVDPIPAAITPSGLEIGLMEVATIPASGSNPVTRINHVIDPDDGSGRLFVPDLRGDLWVVNGGTPTVYLDAVAEFPDFVDSPNLGTGFGFVAFHPDFAANGRFYTVHTEAGAALATTPDYETPIPSVVHGIVTEWTATDPAANVFAGTSREILRIGFGTFLHGLQQIGFDPTAQPADADYGLLYIAAGDGNTPPGADTVPRDLDVPHGKILRIDPVGSDGPNGEYGIPTGNPFTTDPSVLDEIWAYGLRNPHRFSWDPVSEKMLIGNIGENNIESVFLGAPQADYGWNEREGPFLWDPADPDNVYPLPAGDAAFGYTYPVAQYDHDEGFAIVGGFVYRGSAVPGLVGEYLFGDVVNGRIFHVAEADLVQGSTAAIGEVTLYNEAGFPVTMLGLSGASRVDLRFGIDSSGELYALSKRSGKIYRITEPTTPADFSIETVSADVGSSPTAVALGESYVSPVPVCSAQVVNNTAPVVVRVDNLTATGFTVRLQNPGDIDAVVFDTVSCLVVEEGVWTLSDGRSIEAQTHLLPTAGSKGSWTTSTLAYGQTYSDPAVLGQVISSNDPGWSVFWAQGATRTSPPSVSDLRIGFHVAEDTDDVRLPENVGVVIVEQGAGTHDGVQYEFGLSTDSIGDSASAFSLAASLPSMPVLAVLSSAGLDGGDGSWIHPNSFTATSITATAYEDEIGDSETGHTTEQAAYAVFEAHLGDVAPPDTVDPVTTIDAPTDGATLTALPYIVSGTASDNQTVVSTVAQLTDGGGNYWDGTSFDTDPATVMSATLTGGTWTLDVGTVPDGAYTITAWSTDGVGNTDATPPTIDVTLDLPPDGSDPVTTITSPTSGAGVFSLPMVASGTATDDLGVSATVVQLADDSGNYWDGSAWVTDPATVLPAVLVGIDWSVTLDGFAEGSYTLTAWSTDAVGNTDLVPPQSPFTFDFSGPAVGVDTPSAPQLGVPLVLSGTVDDVSVIDSLEFAVVELATGSNRQSDNSFAPFWSVSPAVLDSPGTSSSTWSATITIDDPGLYRIYAKATDEWGFETDLWSRADIDLGVAPPHVVQCSSTTGQVQTRFAPPDFVDEATSFTRDANGKVIGYGVTPSSTCRRSHRRAR